MIQQGKHLVDITGTNILVPCHVVKSATRLKIGHPMVPSMGTQSSTELQWPDFKIGIPESNANNGHQGDMPIVYINHKLLFIDIC